MRRLARGFSLVVGGLAVFGLVACGGGDGGGTTGGGGSISVTASPPTLTVQAGSSGTVTVTLVRGGGFSGDVSVSVTGLPSGVTVSVSPSPLTGSTTQATVTVQVAGSVAPGTYTANVRASASGVGEASTSYTLTVTAAPAIALGVSPATVSVAQAGSGNSTLAITRTAFTGEVALAVSGNPAGMTVAFTPASPVPGATSSVAVAVNVAASVAVGSYPVTITGSGSGVSNATTVLTVTVTVPAVITLGVSPATVSVQQGGSGNSTLTITRTVFAGDVTLAVSGNPAGMTVVFTPASPVPGATSSVAVAVNVAASVAVGTYPVTITGSGTGVSNAATILTVTVSAGPSISFTLNPTSLSIAQGGSGSTTATIVRTNYAGALTMTLTGAPAGMTYTVAPPAPTAGNTATFTISVGGAVATGNYNLVARANGPGVSEATQPLAIQVTQPPGGNTEWQFCDNSSAPLWFAFQDGGGAWTRVLPTTSGNVTRFRFDITQNRGGVAFVSNSGSAQASLRSGSFARKVTALARAGADARRGDFRWLRRGIASAFAQVDNFELSVFYGTAAELVTGGVEQCAGSPGGITVTGSVAGVANTELAFVGMGGAFAFVSPLLGTGFTLQDVRPGTVDLVASRQTASFVADKVIIRRNLTPTNNQMLPVLNFASEGFAPAQANLTAANLLGDDWTRMTSFFTSNGDGGIFDLEPAAPSATRPWYGIPFAQTVNGDLHQIMVLAEPPSLATGDVDSRMISVYTRTVGDRTLTLPARISTATVTLLATTPYARPQATGTVPADYGKYVAIDFEQTAANRDAYLAATGGYLALVGSASSYTLAIPDFTPVSGWTSTWGLLSGGVTTEVYTSHVWWSGTGIQFQQPAEGVTFRTATKKENKTF